MPSNPRMQIIEEMMQERVQSVSAERVAVYYKRLEDIPEDMLRAACVGLTENSQQRGVPTVAEIRRRAGELASRRTTFVESEEAPSPRRECKKLVHQTRFGKLLCCREEGHSGDCEAWFSHDGPQPGDADTVRRLVEAKGKVVSLRQPDELLEDIPF